uniref:Uncharacterized protein n=1 Tax=Anopheles minimus TaxID=112268 RepID=A0A182VTK6_9DIPT
MANETNNTNNKLVLMNDKLFSGVYTAGTNVKKFIQLAGKRNQLFEMMKVSQFVLRLVESRNLPLEVSAKIVCGMGRIILHNLQNILAETLAMHQRSSMVRRIGYGEKNVVRKLKLQLECNGNGQNAGTAAPLCLDLAVANFDVDFHEKITEKEVIFSLESSKNNTTVKNVEDITMRDEPHQIDYCSQLHMSEDNDFGETMPTEMLDFLQSDDEADVNTAMQTIPEPTLLEDMDVDLPDEPDASNHNNSEHQILPLVDTLQPVPMDTSEYDEDDLAIQTIATNDSVEVSISEGNGNAPSNEPLPEAGNNTEEPQITKNTVEERKRRLLMDTRTRISFKCYNQWISNWEKMYANIKKSDVREALSTQTAENKLNSLFTKPLRPCCTSSMFEQKLQLPRKRGLEFDLSDFGMKRPNRTKRITANNVGPSVEINDEPKVQTNNEPPAQVNDKPPVQTSYELQDRLNVSPPIQSPNEDPHFATLGEHPDMQHFLTSFTGKPSEWEHLKNCQPSSNEKDTHNTKESGVVTRYAVIILLDAIFKEVTENVIPFKMLQAKISNRLIAASVFAKLLELSKEKVIRLSTSENGIPDSVHKYENWKQ